MSDQDQRQGETVLAIRQRVAAARGRANAQGRAVLDELLPLQMEGLEEAAPLKVAAAVAEATGVELVLDSAVVAHVLAVMAAAPEGRVPSLHVQLSNGRHAMLMADPWNAEAVAMLTSRIGRYVEPAAATSEVMTQLSQRLPTAALGHPTESNQATGTSAGDSAVVGFVDRAIQAAMREGASDVHFECDRTGVTAKLRLDGVMTPLDRLSGQLQAEEAVSRIKVLAQLDITERRLPQDGRFRFGDAESGLDLRVSIMPSVFGEDAVLRLLDKSHLRYQASQVTLDALGFVAADAKRIRMLSNLPNGMLLVTGPTGSGKTTTVYAALSEINTGLEKIITIEDPVEYELPGVLQIPVNERKGLTFARGLRSILRHDPDRILVGEIRDAETAEIAVQASLTGHLVFTTVHANSLFDVIGRFRHFGIDMFGFVSSLNGVVVQRLMRRLCANCCTSRPASADEREWLASRGALDLLDIPAAAGCEQCHNTGYKGRFVIAEVHQIHDGFRNRVMGQADVTELKRAAFDEHRRPLVELAIGKVRKAQTSLEEVFRVVGQV